MPIRAVIFDFDGTLTESGLLDFAGIRSEIGCPSGFAILEYLECLSLADRDRACRILDRHENEAARRSRPNEGAEELLAWLESRHIPAGVLTRNCRQSVRIACAAMGWRGDFAPVVAREDAPPNPAPAGVRTLLDLFSVSPPEALVVGDYLFDMQAGSAAGCETVFLTNGRKPAFSREEIGWTHEVQRLPELRGLIERLL